MAAFGGAHHQAGFQQMATGFPGVVAGGFIQGGAPKVLLVNNLCEGVSRCFTLWPQCCLTDGWIFQVTCNQIFTLCGVRPTPLRNGGAILDRCGTGPRSYGADFQIPGVQMEKTAKKRKTTCEKWVDRYLET